MATIDFCTRDNVLLSPAMEGVRNASTTDTYLDEYIEQAIRAVSQQVEDECGRWFRLDTYTEVLDVVTGQKLISLRGYPISSITSIKEATDGDFASATAKTSTDYWTLENGRTGQVQMRYVGFVGGAGSVQVIYVGGLANETSALPADLRMACVDQVAFMVRRATTSHLKSESQQQGSVTYFQEASILPAVQHVFDRYRRM